MEKQGRLTEKIKFRLKHIYANVILNKDFSSRDQAKSWQNQKDCPFKEPFWEPTEISD